MKIYYCTNFHGHYPVGASAVVFAMDAFEAAILLESKLRAIGLPQTVVETQMKEIEPKLVNVLILQDGEY